MKYLRPNFYLPKCPFFLSLAYNSKFMNNRNEIGTLCLKFSFQMIGMMTVAFCFPV